MTRFAGFRVTDTRGDIDECGASNQEIDRCGRDLSAALLNLLDRDGAPLTRERNNVIAQHHARNSDADA